jgi:hypothetical protein
MNDYLGIPSLGCLWELFGTSIEIFSTSNFDSERRNEVRWRFSKLLRELTHWHKLCLIYSEKQGSVHFVRERSEQTGETEPWWHTNSICVMVKGERI